MPSLTDLIARHQAAHDRYCRLLAAQQAIGKKLTEAQKERTAVRREVHAAIGHLPPGTLVMSLAGSRFFEITMSPVGSVYYETIPVYQCNGEKKEENKGTPFVYQPSMVVEAGSVKPVPPDHPIYLKWQKRRLRDKLEGKE